MYPKPSGSPENHKRGYCSDGVKQTLPSLELTAQNQDPPQPNRPPTHHLPRWPQPHGIFTNGEEFNVVVFLAKVQELYQRVVVEKDSGEFLMEHEAFAALLATRTVVQEDGGVIFKLFDLKVSPLAPEGLIVVHEGLKYVRMDGLRGT